MVPVDEFRKVIKQIIAEYARYRPSYGDIDSEVVLGDQRDHYELLRVGWQGTRREHNTLIHVDIIDDKVWIQYDGTEEGIADDSMEAGIPQQRIVLAFHPQQERHYTGFAVN
jgi:hypothetical protein